MSELNFKKLIGKFFPLVQGKRYDFLQKLYPDHELKIYQRLLTH